MSLINDYLKKTQNDAPAGADKAGDVPPVLKSIGQRSRRNFVLPVTIFVTVLCFVVVSYILFQLITKQSSYPPRLIASANLFLPHEPVTKSASLLDTGTDDTNRPSTESQGQSEKSVIENLDNAAPEVAPTRLAQKKPEPASETPAEKAPHSSDAPAIIAQAPPVVISPLKKEEPMVVVDVDIDHYYQIALIAQKEGNFRDAEKFYREVLKKEPAHGDALTNLAAVYIHQNKFTDAEKTLRKILRLNPDNTKALVNSGIINISFNQDDQARNYFQKALQINPREETALINLAYLAQKKNDTILMEKYYKQILDIDPDNHEVMLSYASLLETTKRFQEAVAYYQNSLELNEIQADKKLFRQVRERIRLLRYYQDVKSKK